MEKLTWNQCNIKLIFIVFIHKRVSKEEKVKLVIKEDSKDLFHRKFINQIIGTWYCYFTNKYETALKPLKAIRSYYITIRMLN